MNRAEMIKANCISMKEEFEVCHRNVYRKIDAAFVEELKHFKELLVEFNKKYHYIKFDEIDKIEEILNTKLK